MKSNVVFLLILLVGGACNKQTKIDLKGSWYLINDELGYAEICFNDSTYLSMVEAGRLEGRYFIQGDSIYYGYEGDTRLYNYKAFHKIASLKNDTLWLVAKESKNIPNEFWVRLPKNEIGGCELDWAATNFDSVEYKAAIDYDKRRVKYFSIKNQTISKYDSLVGVGYWDWDMEKVKEAKAERIRALEKRLQELEAAQK